MIKAKNLQLFTSDINQIMVKNHFLTKKIWSIGRLAVILILIRNNSFSKKKKNLLTNKTVSFKVAIISYIRTFHISNSFQSSKMSNKTFSQTIDYFQTKDFSSKTSNTRQN